MFNNQLNLTGSLQSLQRAQFGINELLGLDSATQGFLAQQQRVAQQITAASVYNHQTCQQGPVTSQNSQIFDSFNPQYSSTSSGTGGYLGASRVPNPATYLQAANGIYSTKSVPPPFSFFQTSATSQSCK